MKKKNANANCHLLSKSLFRFNLNAEINYRIGWNEWSDIHPIDFAIPYRFAMIWNNYREYRSTFLNIVAKLHSNYRLGKSFFSSKPERKHGNHAIERNYMLRRIVNLILNQGIIDFEVDILYWPIVNAKGEI